MTEKTEALRLAAVPICDRSITWQSQATIELRRLAKVEDEWAALSQDQGKLESQIDRLVAQRDALLEALKLALKLARSIIGHPDDAHTQLIDAAIAKAEEA